MALQRQNVPISLAGGIDTKTDPKQVLPGKLMTLENAIFTSKGRIKKRNGFGSLTSGLALGAALASLDEELLAFDGSVAKAYSPATGLWYKRGDFNSYDAVKHQVKRDQTNQEEVSCAVIGDLCCHAWKTTGVRYSIQDAATGKLVVVDSPIPGMDNLTYLQTSHPKVISLGTWFVIVFVHINELWYIAIDSGNLANVQGPVTVSTGVTTPTGWDVAVVGGKARIAVMKSGPTLFVASLTTSLVLTNASQGGTGISAISVFASSAAGKIVIAYTNGTAITYTVWNDDLTQAKAPTFLVNGSGVMWLAGRPTSDGFDLYWTQTSGLPDYQDWRVDHLTVTAAYAASAASTYLRSVAQYSKPVQTQSGEWLMMLSHVSKLSEQSCFFVANAAGRIVAKLLYPGRGGGHLAYPILQEGALSSSKVSWSVLERALPEAVGEANPVGVVCFTLQPGAYHHVEQGGCLLLSGGLPFMYDGKELVEHGFNLYPEGVYASDLVPGGKTYQYMACYEWVDNKGQRHQSAPSSPVTHTQAAAIDNGANQAPVTVPTLRLSQKTGVKIILYRTEDASAGGGLIFYRTGSADNDPTQNSVVVTDGTTDVLLVRNRQIYTTGGVVENVEPGPIGHMVAYRNRVYAIDPETKTKLLVSREVIPGQPVEFSDLLEQMVDPFGGDLVALGVLDDKLILFKEDGIFFVAGQGPDNTGANSDLQPVRLNVDVGCSEPRSLATIPSGIMFKTPKGIYILDRSLTLQYIGAEVEAFNSQAVVKALTTRKGDQQVRFVLDNGDMLVFDYLFNQWSVFTTRSLGTLVDADFSDGLMTVITDDGAVYRETPGQFADGITYVAIKLVTSWLQIAGLQGFQRVYNLMILGEFFSHHVLTFRIEQDYDASAGQVLAIDTSAPDQSALLVPYQWGIAMKAQRCEAVRVTITESGVTPGEGLAISALSFLVGVKPGQARIPYHRTFG